MHKHPALILGTGVWAQAAAELMLAADQFVYGFIALDDDAPAEILAIPVQGRLDDPELRKLLADPRTDLVLAVDNSEARARLLKELFELTKRLPGNVLHPQIYLSPGSRLDAGNVLHYGCVVQHEAHLQALNYLGAGVVLETGARVGSFNTLQAGVIVAAGAVLTDHIYVGAGAVIGPGVTVDAGALIAPGAVVLQDVDEGQSVFGNPARAV